MARKVRKTATVRSESQLAVTVRESAQEIWLAGLGAFAKAQEEGNKVFEALVKEGEALQERTRKAAERKVVDLAEKATGTWDRLEKVFEDRVARALSQLGVPTPSALKTLSRRVDLLADQIERMSDGATRRVASKRLTSRSGAATTTESPAGAKVPRRTTRSTRKTGP